MRKMVADVATNISFYLIAHLILFVVVNINTCLKRNEGIPGLKSKFRVNACQLKTNGRSRE